MKKLALIILLALFAVPAAAQGIQKPVVLTVVGGLALQDSLDLLIHRKDTVGLNAGTYVTTQRQRDSLAALRSNLVAKKDTTSEKGGSYVTPTQFKQDTTYRATLFAFRDSSGIWVPTPAGKQFAGNVAWLILHGSIKTSQVSGTTVQPVFYFNQAGMSLTYDNNNESVVAYGYNYVSEPNNPIFRIAAKPYAADPTAAWDPTTTTRVLVTVNGRTGIGYTAGASLDSLLCVATGAHVARGLLVGNDATAKQFKLSTLNTAPVGPAATGVTGELRFTADSLFVCTATNTWKAVALHTY